MNHRDEAEKYLAMAQVPGNSILHATLAQAHASLAVLDGLEQVLDLLHEELRGPTPT